MATIRSGPRFLRVFVARGAGGEGQERLKAKQNAKWEGRESCLQMKKNAKVLDHTSLLQFPHRKKESQAGFSSKPTLSPECGAALIRLGWVGVKLERTGPAAAPATTPTVCRDSRIEERDNLGIHVCRCP